MDEISSINCPSTPQRAIVTLRGLGVVKLIQFFEHGPRDIMEMAGIDFIGFEVMRKEILTALRPAPISVAGQCNNIRPLQVSGNVQILSTGNATLNQSLKGGFHPGEIVELFGLPGTGKTLLCLTIALNCCLDVNSIVAYIDTKNGITASLFKSRCQNRASLQRLRIFKRLDLEKTLQTLSDFDFEMRLGHQNMCNRLRMVIVDSLPMCFYPEIDADFGSFRHLLEKFEEQIKRLAIRGIVVILVNHAVTTFKNWKENTSKLPTGIKPALGKYWAHQPAFRISIAQVQFKPNQLELCILKAPRKVTDGVIILNKSDIGMISESRNP